MTTVAVGVSSQEILEGSVKEFEFAAFNVNEMQPVEFSSLLNDMREHGIYGIGPVAAVFKQTLDPQCKDAKWKVVIDGNSRLKAAMELGWPKIRYYVDQSVKTEADARVYVYRRSAERGKINELRLAEAFKWFVDSGFSQKQVAEKFGIDPSTVSHKLSLLKVDPELRKDIASDTRLGMSALEVIATKPVEVQKKVLDSIRADGQFRSWKDGQVPVRWVEAKAQEVVKEAAEEGALKKGLEEAKFPKCPTCGKPPAEADFSGLPNVRCKDFHRWSLRSGAPKAPQSSSSSSSGGNKYPQHVKSGIGMEDWIAAVEGFFSQVWPTFTSVSSLDIGSDPDKEAVQVSKGALDLSDATRLSNVRVTGTVGGKKTTVDLRISRDGYGGPQASVHLSQEVKGENGGEGEDELVYLSFKHNDTDNKGFKTYVKNERLFIDSKKDLESLEESAQAFLKKYGPKTFRQGGVEVKDGEETKKRRGRPPGSKNKLRGSNARGEATD